MNELYEVKLEEMLLEFTRYLADHPDFADRIPNGAHVVLLDREDPEYNRHAIQAAARAERQDDVPNRPIVYVEVEKMAPRRSRMKKLHILSAPPVRAAA